MIERIKNNPQYHGQIFEIKKISEYHPDKKILPQSPIVIDLLNFAGLEGYYEYQSNAVDSIDQGGDLFICGGPKSGKSFTTYIITIDKIIRSSKNVLFICLDKEVDKNIFNFQNLLKESKWETAFTVKKLTEDNDDLNAFKNADCIFTTAKMLFEAVRNSDQFIELSTFLNNLGLIVVDNVNTYSPFQLLHIKYLLKLCKSVPADLPQFVITGNEVRSPDAFIFDFCGSVDVKIIPVENINHQAYSFVYWVPPMLRVNDDLNYEIFERNSFDKELNELMTIIESFDTDDYNVLIWNNTEFANVGDFKSQKIRIQYTRSIFSDDLKKYDMVIIIGYPVGLGNIEEYIGRFLNDEGVGIILPAENPISYSAFRLKQLFDRYQKVDIFLPDNDYLNLFYFILTFNIINDSSIDKETINSIWKTDSPIIRKLFELELIVEEDKKYIVKDIIELNKNQLSIQWGVFSDDVVDIKNIGYVDQEMIKYNLFPDSIIYHGNNKYKINHRINKENNKENRIITGVIAEEAAPYLRDSIINIKYDSENNIDDAKYERNSICVEKVKLTRLKISSDSYVERISDIINNNDIKINKFSPELNDEYDEYEAIKIYGEEAHGIYHAWKLFTEQLFQGINSFIYPVVNNNSLYLIPVIKSQLSVLDYILLRSDVLYDIFSNVVTDVLISDPPYEVTTLSYLLNGCHYCQKKKLSQSFKEDFIQNNKPDLIDIILFKKGEPQEDNFLLSQAKKWKLNIFNLFNGKLDIDIANPVEVSFFANAPDGIAGTFNGEGIKIRKNLCESDFIMVLAHEYGHNWESESMSSKVKFEGCELGETLIMEGFSEWLAFKVCDFYGLKNQINSIDLSYVDYAKGNEYGWGFKLLYWIEENLGGYFSVINFMKNGEIEYLDQSYTIHDIIEKSGWKKYIMNAKSAYKK